MDEDKDMSVSVQVQTAHHTCAVSCLVLEMSVICLLLNFLFNFFKFGGLLEMRCIYLLLLTHTGILPFILTVGKWIIESSSASHLN